jgi:hypothetical protein
MAEPVEQPKSWFRRNVWAMLAFVAIAAREYVCSAPLRDATHAATESAAIATAKDIAIAEVTCRARTGRLEKLDFLIAEGYLRPNDVHTRAFQSFRFRIDVESDGERFLVHALPESTWYRYRFISIDELGHLRWNDGSEADRSRDVVPAS